MPGKKRVSPERFKANLKAFCDKTSPSYVAHKIGLRPKTIYRWLAEGIGWPTHETQDAVLKLAEMMEVNDWHDLWYFDWADRQGDRQYHERLDKLLADPQTRKGVIEFLMDGEAPPPEDPLHRLLKFFNPLSNLGAQVVKIMGADEGATAFMLLRHDLEYDMKQGLFTGDVEEWLQGQLERFEKSQADNAERQAKLRRKRRYSREAADDSEPRSLYSPVFSDENLQEIDDEQADLDWDDLKDDE
jgi:hypothetical protein